LSYFSSAGRWSKIRQGGKSVVFSRFTEGNYDMAQISHHRLSNYKRDLMAVNIN
jgi:hypothetical protein